MKKLNPRGFAHHLVLVVIVLAAAIGGTYYLVASHAQVPYVNPYSCSTDPQLRSGSTGTCVKYLQYALASTSTSPGLAVDGSFGQLTQAAVIKFQTAHGLVADGIVGPLTWGKVNTYNATETSSTAIKNVYAPTGTVALNVCTATLSGSESDADRAADGARLLISVSGATAIGFSTATHSYSWAIPSIYKDGKDHSISVLGHNVNSQPAYAGTNTALAGSPLVYNSAKCAPPKVLVTAGPTPVLTPAPKPPVVTPAPAAPVATLPVATDTASCIKIYGPTFTYDAPRCYSIVKPVCPAGTVVVATKNNADFNIYSCDKAPVVATKAPVNKNPLVTCTYFIGANEKQVTDAKHRKSFCDRIHKNQVAWKDCPVVVNGKPTTAVHSVAYCAKHKVKPVEKVKPPVLTTAELDRNCKKEQPVLKVGSTGSCVNYAQRKVGAYPDGSFGEKTAAKVATYQTNHGINNDGQVGRCTWSVFITGEKGPNCPPTTNTTTASPSSQAAGTTSTNISSSSVISCSYRNPAAPHNVPLSLALVTKQLTPRQCSAVHGTNRSASSSSNGGGVQSVSYNYYANNYDSGYLDWHFDGSKKYTGNVISSDGWICFADTFNHYNLFSTLTDKYSFDIEKADGLYFGKVISSKNFYADGNRDHQCFQLTRGVKYTVSIKPAGTTYMHGSYQLWGYKHD